MTDSSQFEVEQPERQPVEVVGHLVVVPRTIGPVVDADAASGGTTDELDAAIDEVFGETTDDQPGPLDAALLIGGVALSIWALVTGASGLLLVVGVLAALLGVALPARSLARGARRRRQVARRRKAVGAGLPLDASHPAVAALVSAYDACLRAAAQPGVPEAGEAADAAHLALVEVASLLAGGQPISPAEIEYVTKRRQAIQDVTLQLKRAHRAWIEARLDASIHAGPADREWATAVTQAREELESTTGLGSLDRLAGVGRSLDREAGDVGG